MKTINLLPKPRQQELKFEGILHRFLLVIWFSLFSFALVFGIQLGTKIYLQQKAKSITNQIKELSQQVNKTDNATLKTKIKSVNDVVSDFITLTAASPKWSHFLKAFSILPPVGVSILSVTVDNKSKQVQLNGYSPSRDLVIEMYNNLNNDKTHFSNVDYPLENVVKETDINFHFSFFVNSPVLQ